MSGVNRRHVGGAILGAFAAWLVVLGFSSLYSILLGFGPLDPFTGTGSVLGFQGTKALVLGLGLDFVIPLVAAIVFLLALALLSRSQFTVLEFVSRARALGAGALLGLVVWAVFYIPVIYELTHPTPSQFVGPLLFGFVDHLVFGAVIGLLIFLVGGPVPFARRTMSPPT